MTRVGGGGRLAPCHDEGGGGGGDGWRHAMTRVGVGGEGWHLAPCHDEGGVRGDGWPQYYVLYYYISLLLFISGSSILVIN